jgi:aminoglycoside phosphotransferase (APT) family kinase protein
MPETPWPEEQWERRTQTVALDLDMISRMIAPVFAPREVVSAHLLSGGLANTNYLVGVAGMRERFVLRLYTRDPAACRIEADLYALVHDRVPLPAIFYADTEGERMGSPYMLREWAEATPLVELLSAGSEQEIESAGYSAGSVLAAIASYTFPQAGFFGPDLIIAEPLQIGPSGFLALLNDWLFKGHAGKRLRDELTHRLWQFVSLHAPLLEGAEGTPALVHGDYKASNLLIRKRGDRWEIAAVLDWEFAFAGPPLFDLAILLRHERADSPFTRAVAHGYTDSGGALPSDWRRITRLLDLLNLVQFLGLPGERPNLTRDVTRLITATMDEWIE